MDETIGNIAVNRTVFLVEFVSKEEKDMFIVAKDFSMVMKTIRNIKHIPDSVENIFEDYVLAINRIEDIVVPTCIFD